MSGALIRNSFLKFLSFLLVIVLLSWLGRYFHLDRALIQEKLSRFPLIFSGIVFVIVYVVSSSVVWLGPKDVLRLAAVFVYGPYVSTVFVTVAELGNLPIMFLLSRRMGRPFVAERLKGGMKEVDQAIAETSFGMIFFLKLLLFIPLRFLDLGFGLTQISLLKYFFISLLATPLRIFVVQFFWSLGMETVMNPNKFSQYLLNHPQIMLGTGLYFVGSLVMVGVMKGRADARRGKITV